jgi:hypothetical protein
MSNLEFLNNLKDSTFESIEFAISIDASYDPSPDVKSSKDGKCVPVVRINYDNFREIYFVMKDGLKNENNPYNQIYKILTESCPPKATTFNFECCSGLKLYQFPNDLETFEGIGYFLRNSYIIQMADFSLKCLISAWKNYETEQKIIDLFGSKCPLNYTSSCDHMIKLAFNSDNLKNCCVAQLRAVGILSEQNHLTLHAMCSTIVFTCDLLQDSKYETEVLTTVEHYDNKICESGEIGHIVFKYPEGGILICGMGHFCELNKIHTSREKMLGLASQMCGELSNDFIQRISENSQDQNAIASQMISCMTSNLNI